MSLRPRECAMRLAFWRAGKVMDVVQRAVGKRAAAVSKPAPRNAAASKPIAAPKSIEPPESGDLDLHALGQALLAKRSLIIVPTVLVAVLSMAARTSFCGRTASAMRSAPRSTPRR